MLFQQSVNKIKIIKMCIYLIVLALIFKVGYIQIIDRKNIYDKALESWQRSFPVQANRGKIYDRSENVLATDLTTASLVVVPSQIKDQATTALELSKILNLDVNVLKEKLNKKVWIQRISPEGRQLDNQVASKIQRLHLSGVYLIKDTKRYYPGNNYLSHCLGFVGIDNQGLLGLELEYDSFLKGKNGSIDYYMDAKSHNLKMYPSHYTYSQSGMNITLTIDKRVQDVIERELSNAYDTYHPDGIWALAMNPKNGEILGIASYPNFNPNDYQNEDKDIYNQNIPIWKTYEPGSTFKIITFSSALNENLFDMFVGNILFAGRNASSLDSLTSGRVSIVSEFPTLIEGHWLTGIGSLYFECFPLSCILQFGIITGSIIIGIAYLPVIKSLKLDRTNVYSSILVIVCIGYGINSIFEGLAPIGPGVKCYYMWLMYGILFARGIEKYA